MIRVRRGRREPGGNAAACLCLCLGLAVAGMALGETSARAEGDDRSAAEALVKPLEQAASSPITAEALAGAKGALEQATRLRAAGDEAHAKAADGLAREWAETARDLSLAAAAERLADDRKRQSMQAQAQLERTRALVEEGIARLGRIRAELEAVPPKPVKAVEMHDGDPKPRAATKAQAAANGSTP